MTNNKALAEHIRNYLESGVDLLLTDDDYKTIIKALEQEPCEDCISRQLIYEIGATCIATRNENGKLIALGAIEELPSVNSQEPKTGHWIVEIWNNREHHTCSECNHVVNYEPCYHYCPYCGAKMEE